MADRVIIIGAGMGGLVAAALCAARGDHVTVVEAQAGPGGKLRAIDVAGDAVDAGPTVFTLRDTFAAIFAECGASIDDYLTVRPAALLARHGWGADARLDLFADPTASEAAIGDFAGAGEARGYRAFRAEAQRIFDALEPSFLHAPKTDPLTLTWRIARHRPASAFNLRPYESMWKALGGYFRDSRLRQLFGRYATYCGSSPFACPATLMLIAHVEARGVWLIDGGMHALARALESLGRSLGVTYRYDSPVAAITVAHGRASGVGLASGEHLAARAVICNADPAAIAAGRFGPAAAGAVAAVPPAARSLGAFVWLARATANGFPLVRHNVLFSNDYPAEFAALGHNRLAGDPTVYVCAQDRDDIGACARDGAAERFQIIVNAPPRGDRGGFSPSEIDQCTNAMRNRLSQAGLSLDLQPEATRLLTPTEFEQLCPSTGGALYGRASHGWAASFRRQGSRTRIPGLYCAGGSTHPGAGLPMAALSASLAVDCWRKDRASTSRSMPRAMPGGTSTRTATTGSTG